MIGSYNKHQRLKKKKDIARIFADGSSVLFYPLLFRWRFVSSPTSPNLLYGVGVPKRKIRKAVHRNLIKRRMREAFRLNKSELESTLEAKDGQLQVMTIFIAKETLGYDKIESATIKGLRHLSDKYR